MQQLKFHDQAVSVRFAQWGGERFTGDENFQKIYFG